MKLANLIIDNQVGKNLNFKKASKISKKYTNKLIELIITDNKEIKKLNKEYRNIDKATDVLSFPLNDNFYLGSIVISYDYIKKAYVYNHSRDSEFLLLFIHGLGHLLGYDHEIDNLHREFEKKLIREFNLPKSLIIRS